MQYEEPTRIFSSLNLHEYGDPEDVFYVHDCFNAITRCIDQRQMTSPNFRLLAGITLQLFGWAHLPLTQKLLDPKATHEDLWNARQLNSAGERISPLGNYWSVRNGLLSLPLSWERPGLIEGDPICNSVIRRPIWDRYPLFQDKPYRQLSSKLTKQAIDAIKTTFEIDKAIVSVYGAPTSAKLTLAEILQAEPSLRTDFFCPFDLF